MSSDSPGQSAAALPGATMGVTATRERLRVVALGCSIVLAIGIYLVLRSGMTDGGGLMPFQTLARDLVPADQAMFTTLKERTLGLETLRAQTGRWPDPTAAGLPREPPGREGATASTYTWHRSERGIIVNYLARPAKGDSSAAWLIVYREPDPSAPTDTAPNDEEHHRLPDGTVLHVSIWTRRFGGQVPADFLPQPEVAGWTQVLTAPIERRAPPFAATPPR